MTGYLALLVKRTFYSNFVNSGMVLPHIPEAAFPLPSVS